VENCEHRWPQIPVAATYLKIDATNMINGMSNENPALDFVRCIEYVWSAYEVIGEIMMKIGAIKPVTNDAIPMLRRMLDRKKKLKKYVLIIPSATVCRIISSVCIVQNKLRRAAQVSKIQKDVEESESDGGWRQHFVSSKQGTRIPRRCTIGAPFPIHLSSSTF
jgi:hypothetical protein